jgi:hypothetical protein
MNMSDKKRLVVAIVAYGALWGFLEATLGWALHWVPALISGSVMFPIGAAILMRFRGRTGSDAAILGVGAVAAAIKAVDLLLPVPSLWKVFNPMICILLESAVVLLLAKAIDSRRILPRLVALPTASIAWRFLFLGTLFVQFMFTHSLSSQLSSVDAILTFAVVNGAFSGALAIGVDAVRRVIPDRASSLFLKPAFAGLLVVAAFAATYLI